MVTINPVKLLLVAIIFATSCSSGQRPDIELNEEWYNVAFLIMDGVYNTELTAPYDIFQHTQYREGIKAMNVFTIAESKSPVRSFEGLYILPDFSYRSKDLPKIDILVIPSAEHHLDSDLENEEMISFVKNAGEEAEYITSHCDGAFVLAKAGLLDGLQSTTFPSDIDLYKETFPNLEVISDVLFVHDDKAITSAGGAKSFEAALYLTEYLYGAEIARSIAKGLVIDWNLSDIKYLKIE